MLAVKLYFLPVLLLLIAIMLFCVKAKKLTLPAGIAAMLLGSLVYLSAKEKGLILLFTFFILSVLATAHGKRRKVEDSSASIHPEGRDVWQVFANGGMSGVLAVAMLIDPTHQSLYFLMMAASLAAALSDTLSSELGTVYGRDFFHILSFRKDTKGLDGVVSIEGTFIGAVAAGLMGVIYGGWSRLSLYVAIGGFLGNLMDSVLGAALERRKYIGNNTVNFLNTLFAALVALLCILVTG